MRVRKELPRSRTLTSRFEPTAGLRLLAPSGQASRRGLGCSREREDLGGSKFSHELASLRPGLGRGVAILGEFGQVGAGRLEQTLVRLQRSFFFRGGAQRHVRVWGLGERLADRIDFEFGQEIEFFLDRGVKNSIEISKILKEVLPEEAAEPSGTGAAVAEEADETMER